LTTPSYPPHPALPEPTYGYASYSFVDAIACAICNIVAFSSLVGRIRTLEIFILTLIGTFLYLVNEQLIWRYLISDTGYGMRIFIYGGMMGFISSLILWKRDTTVDHKKYFSNYSTRAFSLLGLIVQFCTFPCLVAGSIFMTSNNNGFVLYSSVLRMYFALIGAILGAFSASAIVYKKIIISDLVFGALSVKNI
jgi:hypothetical protein